MRVSIIQNDPEFGRPAENARRLAALMAEEREASLSASGEAPGLYVLPELCCTGYAFTGREEALALSEEASGGPSLDILARAARDLGGALAFGFPERAGERLFNSQLLLRPSGERDVYRKTHLYDAEADCFEPGDSGFLVRDLGGLRVGLAICFDWIFPESFRSLALLGADLIAHSANLVLPWCQRAGFLRALENGVYLATANRSGAEARGGRLLSYSGASVAYGPRGDLLASLPPDGEGRASFDADPALSRDKSLGRNDRFRDRRPQMYFLH